MFCRIALLSALMAPFAVLAADSTEFKVAHDSPRTASPSPVPEGVEACTVEVLHHGFATFEPVHTTLDAARDCPGPWHKVVLRLDGAVKGRQYDRIGHLAIGGITIFRTSTPEPSPEGITWQVEKDVTAYAPLLMTPQSVEMVIGNVVNDTYTGIFDVRITLQFYRADAGHPAANTAHQVLALDGLRDDGQETAGMITIPATAERVVAEVYATGSGGGCEEFWYFSAPASDYWCRASHGPYREVQVYVDGRLAGIAAPYPHIYTGGWSNPFLWYTIPAPRAFNISPIQYELTPFIGLLNDGKAHEIRFRVAGLDSGREGWALMPNVQVWESADGQPVTVTLLQADLVESSSDSALDAEPDRQRQQLRHDWQRRFIARASLTRAQGEVEIGVERHLRAEIRHQWAHEEDRDDHLKAQWHDDQTLTWQVPGHSPEVERMEQQFGLDGSISSVQVDGKSRVRTTIEITDASRHSRVDASQRESYDHFNGSASWTRNAPRAQRDAIAHSQQTWWSQDISGGEGDRRSQCHVRQLESRNGAFTLDRTSTQCDAGRGPAGNAN